MVRKIMFTDRYGLTQAVIDSRKTMTRRIIPNIPCFTYKENGITKHGGIEDMEIRCGDTLMLKFRGDWYTAPNECQPKYKVGEVVAVAQSYSSCIDDILYKIAYTEDKSAMRAKLGKSKGWNNKMFVHADLMPYRIKITDIKVEKLQDISDEDCFREGILKVKCGNHRHSNLYPFYFEGGRHEFDNSFSTPRQAFAALIDKVSGKGTWERNPWVFVYEFELCTDK